MFSSVFVIHKNCFAIKYPPFVVTDYYYVIIPHKHKNRNPFLSELRFLFGGEGALPFMSTILPFPKKFSSTYVFYQKNWSFSIIYQKVWKYFWNKWASPAFVAQGRLNLHIVFFDWFEVIKSSEKHFAYFFVGKPNGIFVFL